MRGFTLIELMVVIAIIAILATFVALDAAQWSRESRLGEGRDRLTATLEELKLKSIAGVPHGIRIASGLGTGYSVLLLVDNNGDLLVDAGDTKTTTDTIQFPPRYLISINGSHEELWFDRKGMPRTGGWNMLGRTITIWYDTNNNGALDSSESRRNITISVNGRIQI